MDETCMVRVPTAIIKEFRKLNPELEGITYTAVVRIILQKALKEQKELSCVQ